MDEVLLPLPEIAELKAAYFMRRPGVRLTASKR
jgi:hypothetical protein